MKSNIINMKVSPVEFTLANKTYPLIFDMNVVAEIESEYGNLEEWLSKIQESSIKTAISTLAILINEAVYIHNDESSDKWELVDCKKIGRLMNMRDIETVLNVIMETFKAGTPQSDDTEENSKNAVTE